jgi:serine/threonine protein kinase
MDQEAHGPRQPGVAPVPGRSPLPGHSPAPGRSPAVVIEPPHVPGLQVLRSLGRGAHGEVWAAVDLGSGEQVAVKLRRTGPGRQRRGNGDDAAEGAERLAREIALLRRIDHPHVVRLRRVLDLPDGSRAMVLDHAAGGSLAGLVRSRGPLMPGEVVTVLVALGRALADLHAGGVVHGDLSPGNVLFTGDGRPLLADLGLAAVLGADRDAADWATPGFADSADLPAGDPGRDVWGLGAVAWYALTGAPATAVLTGGPDQGGGGYPEPDPGQRPTTTSVRDVADLTGPVHPGAVPVGEVLQTRDAGRRAALLRLIRDCLSDEPARRPAASDIARLAWRTLPPAPIRLSAGGSDREGPDAPVRWSGGGLPAGKPAAPSPGPPSGPLTGPLPGPLPGPPSGLLSGPPPGPLPGPFAARLSSGPVRLPDERDGVDDGLDVTRRVREAARSGSDHDRSGRRHRWWPESGVRRHRRWSMPGGRTVAARWLVAAALVGGGAGWAVLARGDLGFAGAAGLPRADAGGSSVVAGIPVAPSVVVPSGVVPSGVASSGQESPAGVCVTGDPSAAELARAVCTLARGRAAAFATASAELLGRVDEPGSAAMAVDTGLVRRLQQRGLRLRGVAFAVTGVRVEDRTADTVTVAASVATSAHNQVRADGGVAATVPATGARGVRLVLVLVRGPGPGGAGWRVRSSEGL